VRDFDLAPHSRCLAFSDFRCALFEAVDCLRDEISLVATLRQPSADFHVVFMHILYALNSFYISLDDQGIGEGGIRTLDTLLGYGALAKRCFRPLSHLTKLLYSNALQLFVAAENWEL
jgi:hypothetical protein